MAGEKGAKVIRRKKSALEKLRDVMPKRLYAAPDTPSPESLIDMQKGMGARNSLGGRSSVEEAVVKLQDEGSAEQFLNQIKNSKEVTDEEMRDLKLDRFPAKLEAARRMARERGEPKPKAKSVLIQHIRDNKPRLFETVLGDIIGSRLDETGAISDYQVRGLSTIYDEQPRTPGEVEGSYREL